MAKQTVPLYTVTSGERVERARTSLAEALGDAKLGDADDAGVFEVAVDAESPDAARELVREAFARAGTGDDFVIRETTEGREIPATDPRQAPAPDGDGDGNGARAGADPAARVADAASSVAAAAAGAAREAASSDAATATREAAADAASSVRDAAAGAAADAATSAREAAADAATSVRDAAAGGAWQERLRQFAPIGGLLFLLVVVRRARR